MITVEYSFSKQVFKSKVVGVSFDNEDGTKRQEIIKNTKVRTTIFLERDYFNEFDVFAIKVLNHERKQIGFLPTDRRLSSFIDSGGETNCFIFKKIGEKTFFEKLFSNKTKTVSCIIEISKERRNPEKAKKYDTFSKEDKDLQARIEEIQKKEKEDLYLAIDNYRDVTEILKSRDSKGNFEKANRYTRIPINRLTTLLEKAKNYNLAFDYLLWYKEYNDIRGITQTETEALEKRFARIEKKRTPNNGYN